MSIKDNILRLKEKIQNASEKVGRSPDEITLVAVSKTISPERIEEAIIVDEQAREMKTTVQGWSKDALPLVFSLSQNYPNPFKRSTIINYQLPVTNHVSLKIYDVTGRLVKTLVNEPQKAGYYTAHWDGKDNLGKTAANGIYFYRIEADDFTDAKKAMLIR